MKKFIGKVISNKMAKTVVVETERSRIHPLYKKRMRIKRNYYVHDEIGVNPGDRVKFIETRPISKTKKWKIVEVVK